MEADEAGENALFSVIDHGIGLTEEERASLFAPFQRVRNERTRNVVGAGLGLYITRSLVEGMGGSISVDSRLRAGSRFQVSLPMATAEPADATRLGDGVAVTTTTLGRRVLRLSRSPS